MSAHAQQTSGAPAPDVVARGARLSVALRLGDETRAIEAYGGETLLTALKRAGLPLLAVCGGKGACGTCRVGFDAVWAIKLNPSQARERRLLDHLKSAEGERLSCQIALTSALDGLEVRTSN